MGRGIAARSVRQSVTARNRQGEGRHGLHEPRLHQLLAPRQSVGQRQGLCQPARRGAAALPQQPPEAHPAEDLARPAPVGQRRFRPRHHRQPEGLGGAAGGVDRQPCGLRLVPQEGRHLLRRRRSRHRAVIRRQGAPVQGCDAAAVCTGRPARRHAQAGPGHALFHPGGQRPAHQPGRARHTDAAGPEPRRRPRIAVQPRGFAAGG